jgi:Protein of unknown function (DUF3375)
LALDIESLESLRVNHPAWRLLCAESAPLIASFLDRTFIQPNVRSISQADLVEILEDELYIQKERQGKQAVKKSALEYLNDWAANDKGWLRKFYPKGSDEPHFDLTPSTEKAIAWLQTLTDRAFVGTESRLLMLFELLKQMCELTETDPQLRIAELQLRRDAIEVEIDRIVTGEIAVLDDTALEIASSSSLPWRETSSETFARLSTTLESSIAACANVSHSGIRVKASS